MKINYYVLMLFIASVILSLVMYSQLSNELAIRWLDGDVPITLPRWAAVTVIPVLLSVLFASQSFMSSQNRVKRLFISIFAGVLFACHVFILIVGLEYSIHGVALLGLCLGVFMMGIGVIMPQVKRNPIFGARNRWTLENDQVWIIVNRLAGKLFFVCGLIIFIGAIVAPAYQMAVVLSSVLINVVIIQRYSHITYQRVTSE